MKNPYEKIIIQRLTQRLAHLTFQMNVQDPLVVISIVTDALIELDEITRTYPAMFNCVVGHSDVNFSHEPEPNLTVEWEMDKKLYSVVFLFDPVRVKPSSSSLYDAYDHAMKIV